MYSTQWIFQLRVLLSSCLLILHIRQSPSTKQSARVGDYGALFIFILFLFWGWVGVRVHL